MKYTDFDEKMLVALYQESSSEDISAHQFKKLAEKYGIEAKRNWIIQLADEWDQEGYARIRKNIGDPLTWSAVITGGGLRWVEDHYGDKEGVGTILTPVTDQPSVLQQASVSSAAWTGLPPSFVLSDGKQQALVSELGRLEEQLPVTVSSQQVRAQVRAYIIAARALLEAPDPQPDIAWEVLNRANAIAGVASLFVALFGLFV